MIADGPDLTTALDLLTPRQLELARLIAQGKTDKQIIAEARISWRGLRKHIAEMGKRLACDRARSIRVQIAVIVATNTRRTAA